MIRCSSRLAVASLLVACAPLVARADDAGDLFDLGKTSLDRAAVARTAAGLVEYAQAQAKANAEFHIAGDYRAMVRVAHQLAPDAASVVAAHARIKKGLAPEAPKKNVARDELVKALLAHGKTAREGKGKDDAVAARYLVAVALMIDPKNDASLVESEKLKSSEIPWDRVLSVYRRTIEDGFTTSINGLVVMTVGTTQVGQVARVVLTYRNTGKTPLEVKFLRETGGTMVASMDEAIRYWDGLLRKSSILPGGTVEISFEDKFTKKDGPSAGGAYTVLMRSFSDPFQIDPEFAMTGDISVEGRILQIGGVYAKIRGATLAKCTRVGVPVSNEGELTDAIVLNGPSALAEIEVYGLETTADAVALARTDKDERVTQATAQFVQLRPLIEAKLKAGDKEKEKSPEIQKLTSRILELAPRHMSAKLIDDWNNGRLPATLSLNGSLEETGNILFRYLVTISTKNQQPNLADIAQETKTTNIAVAQKNLKDLKPKLHADAAKVAAKMEEVCNAIAKYIQGAVDIESKDKQIKSCEKRIDDYKAKINRAKAENKSVDEQNRLVKAHNSVVEEQRKAVEAYNKAIEDRKETFTKIGTLYTDYSQILRGMTQDPKILEKLAHGK